MNKFKLLIPVLLLIVLSSFVFALSITPPTIYYSFDNSNISGTNPLDLSGNGHDGTGVSTITNITGKVGQAFYLNGETGFINLNTATGTGSQSVCMWVKINETGSDYDGLVASSGRYWSIALNPGTGKIRCYTESPGVAQVDSITSYATNGLTWQHVCCISDGSKLRIYINGVNEANVSGGNPSSSEAQYAGSTGAGAGLLKTVMDEFYYYQGVMNFSDITALYNGGIGYNPYAPALSPGTSMNISAGSVATNTYYNYSNTVALNVTVNSTINFGCSLNINSTVNSTVTGITSGNNRQVNFTYIAPDLKRTYSYSINCSGNATVNATTPSYIFYIDSVLQLGNFTSLNATQTANKSRAGVAYNSTRDFNLTLFINNLYFSSSTITASMLGGYLNTFLVNMNLTEGINYFYFKANDTIGNSLSTDNRTIYYDSISPVITSNLDGNASYFTGILFWNVTASDPISLWSLNISTPNLFNYSTGGLTSPYTARLNLSIINQTVGIKTANATVCDGFISALTCTTYQYTFDNRAMINITGNDSLTSLPIQAFSIYKNGTLAGSATAGNYTLNDLTAGSYNITFDAPGYVLGSRIVTIGTNTTNYQTFQVYSTNSLNMFIKDETSGSGITENVSIKFITTTSEWTNYSNGSSTFFISDLDPTDYQITFSSTSYSPRTYTVTVGNRTTQNLNVWLVLNTSSSTLFTITDKDSSEVMSNVLTGMYKYSNGSWQTVESKYSDITGKISFLYTTGTNYKFYLSKAGYTDYVFYLNPILFSTYDIKMTKASINKIATSDFSGVSVIYAPTTFKNNNVTVFNWIISSPGGYLTDYGMTLTYPGGTNGSTGTNAIGGQLSNSINIINAGYFDDVVLNYYYATTLDSVRRNFTFIYSIQTTSEGNTTFFTNRDQTYGLGIFERMLIITLALIFVLGIATLVGQGVPGFALALIVAAYAVFVGFVPGYFFIVSAIMGMFFISWKSGGY